MLFAKRRWSLGFVMDGANVNGGNAAVPREVSNLESGGDGGGGASAAVVPMVETPDSSDKAQLTAGGNADAQEINGELRGSPRKRGPGASIPRKKMRKFKANSTGAMEIDAAEAPGTRGRKRKLSEYEDASSEDSEFNGFDSHGLELQPGSHVLNKLIGKIRCDTLYYQHKGPLHPKHIFTFHTFFLKLLDKL